jgi:hypothetical protein
MENTMPFKMSPSHFSLMMTVNGAINWTVSDDLCTRGDHDESHKLKCNSCGMAGATHVIQTASSQIEQLGKSICNCWRSVIAATVITILPLVIHLLKFGDVQLLIDDLWNGFDFGAELLLNFVQ